MENFMKWVDSLFDDVGKKIQTFAKRFFIIVLALDALAGLILLLVSLGSSPLVALVVVVSFLVIAIVDSLTAFPLYAFGQLVDDIHKTQMNTRGSFSVMDDLPEL